MNTLLDAGYPKGALNYWKAGFFAGLTDELIGDATACFAEYPSNMGAMIFEHFHGAVTRVGVTDTAWPHRHEGFNFVLVSEWMDPALTDQCIAWARSTYAKLEPHMEGSRYVNYMDADDTAVVRSAYGPNYDRLARIKRRYDPENVFRHNQNIPPAT
jgi:FAD/FMN-containing dehydrogenase